MNKVQNKKLREEDVRVAHRDYTNALYIKWIIIVAKSRVAKTIAKSLVIIIRIIKFISEVIL